MVDPVEQRDRDAGTLLAAARPLAARYALADSPSSAAATASEAPKCFLMERSSMTSAMQPMTPNMISKPKMLENAAVPWASIMPPYQVWMNTSGRKPMTDSRPEAVPKMAMGILTSDSGEEPMEKAP